MENLLLLGVPILKHIRVILVVIGNHVIVKISCRNKRKTSAAESNFIRAEL